MIHDASVTRNFAVLGWTDHLRQLGGGRLLIAHGVIGAAEGESMELERIRDAFERETRRERAGSGRASIAMGALIGLERLIGLRGRDLEVVMPDSAELRLALDLQRPTPDLRARLGITARRLDSGEAISIAIAVTRGLWFASDDDAGRVAYLALGGPRHRWTLDLVREAVRQGLLDEPEARAGYERLRRDFDFWGTDWD